MTAVLASRDRLRRWAFAPTATPERVTFLAAAYFAVAFNGVFWREFLRLTGGAEPLMGASLFTAMVALHWLLLLAISTRRTVKPLVTLLLLATASAAYYMARYKVYFDVEMVRNVLATDARESRELLTSSLVAWLSLSAVLPAILLWRVQIPRLALPQAIGRRMMAIGAALLLALASLGASFPAISSLMRTHHELRHLVTPGNFVVSGGRLLSERWASADGPRRVGEDARHVPSGGRPRLLVIVVGETVRAQNWGLNGYARNTTPGLSRRDVVNFPDVTACGTSTEVSLPCMFSDLGRRNYDRSAIQRSDSLLHVLERAGIQTTWYDNQSGCKGVCRGLEFVSLATGKDPRACRDGVCFDEVLLQGLQAELAKPARDKVVVLHQMGNHGPAYDKRYPDPFRIHQPVCSRVELGTCTRESIINAYDNAITYTDSVLSSVIDTLAGATDRDTAMIYVSDHGESLGEANLYLHGLPRAIAPDTQLKVPMVVWLSPARAEADGRCLRALAGLPVSHDNLFSSVLGFMEVQTSAYDAGLDLFAPCPTGQRH